MSNLLTDHPIALNALFDETLFSDGFSLEHSAQEMQKGGFESAKSQLFTKETNSSTAEVVEEFIYTGSLAKGVLFILRYPEFEYFSDGARDAFQKSLAAVGLKEEDVAVVNLANAHNPNDFKRIMGFFQPKKITLLGVEPKSLKLPEISHNSYMRGRVAIVFNTFSFEEMFVDMNKKKAFWLEFKKFMTED